MILTTLKTKKNISLILDDEFIQFCELNEIEDIEKLAKETFKRGFDLLKYGNMPEGELTPQDKGIVTREVTPVQSTLETEKIVVPDVKTQKFVEAIPMKSSDGKDAFEQMGMKPVKKEEKKDLYGE